MGISTQEGAVCHVPGAHVEGPRTPGSLPEFSNPHSLSVPLPQPYPAGFSRAGDQSGILATLPTASPMPVQATPPLWTGELASSATQGCSPSSPLAGVVGWFTGAAGAKLYIHTSLPCSIFLHKEATVGGHCGDHRNQVQRSRGPFLPPVSPQPCGTQGSGWGFYLMGDSTVVIASTAQVA